MNKDWIEYCEMKEQGNKIHCL